MAPYRAFTVGEGCDSNCEEPNVKGRALGAGGWHAAHDAQLARQAGVPPGGSICDLCRCNRCAKCDGRERRDPCVQ